MIPHVKNWEEYFVKMQVHRKWEYLFQNGFHLIVESFFSPFSGCIVDNAFLVFFSSLHWSDYFDRKKLTLVRLRDHPFMTSANFYDFWSLPPPAGIFLLLSISKFGKFLTPLPLKNVDVINGCSFMRFWTCLLRLIPIEKEKPSCPWCYQ